jgi:DNA-binding protein H-NS
MIDFDSMTILEIEALIADASAAIEHRRLRAKAELRARLATEAEALGFTLEDVLREFAEGRPAEKGVKGTTYVNPNNPAQTWRGDGKKPGWLKEYELGGGLISDLAQPLTEEQPHKPKRADGARSPKPRLVDRSSVEVWIDGGGGPGAKPPGA